MRSSATRPLSVCCPPNTCSSAVTSVAASVGVSAGSITIAPRSPRRTCSCDTWCEWYQYVPASVASNRYTWRPPTGTASCVMPATPSAAFGTSMPCQCSVAPSATDSFTKVTSTRSPCRARISGPGDVPFTVYPSMRRPPGTSNASWRATSSTRTSAGRSGSAVRAVTLTSPMAPMVPDAAEAPDPLASCSPWPACPCPSPPPPPLCPSPMAMTEYSPSSVELHARAPAPSAVTTATPTTPQRRSSRRDGIGGRPLGGSR